MAETGLIRTPDQRVRVFVSSALRELAAERQALVAQLMDRWQEYLAVGMRSLQAAGRLPSDLDVEERSASLLAAIQGGVAILQATGRIYHLRAALDMGIADLCRVGRMHDEVAASAAGRA